MPTNSTRLIMEGRLTIDPVSHMDGKMLRFGLASDDDYQRTNGEWVEQTIFLETQCWNGVADRARKLGLRKGDKISVIGQIKQSPDKNDPKKTWTKVWASEVNLLARKGDGSKQQTQAPKPAGDVPPMDADDLGFGNCGHEDVPF